MVNQYPGARTTPNAVTRDLVDSVLQYLRSHQVACNSLGFQDFGLNSDAKHGDKLLYLLGIHPILYESAIDMINPQTVQSYRGAINHILNNKQDIPANMTLTPDTESLSPN
ncbi:hypothetical protein HYX06_00720 [Candidatus Woesearchaeota archaeon]|nr:hypothetical protein [Candidatus Woesearchaeota archaeon]